MNRTIFDAFQMILPTMATWHFISLVACDFNNIKKCIFAQSYSPSKKCGFNFRMQVKHFAFFLFNYIHEFYQFFPLWMREYEMVSLKINIQFSIKCK